MKRHTILFTRHEGMSGMTNAAVLILETADDAASCTDATDMFKRGITEWVNDTQAGREVWEVSREDLNIGNLLLAQPQDDEEFVTILRRHGVKLLSMEGLSWDATEDYDTVLPEEPEEPSAYVVWAASGKIETFTSADAAQHELAYMTTQGDCRGIVYTDRAEAERDVADRRAADAEEQRRDEKRGLYPDKEDQAN